MNFLTGLFGAALQGVSKGVVNPLTSGAIIGGVGGLLSSDANTMTQRLQDAASGMAKGAVIGGLMPWSNMGKALYQTAWSQKGNAWKLAKGAGSMAGKAAGFMARNSTAIAALGIGAYGANKILNAYGQSGTSPTMSGAKVKANYSQQSLQADSMNSMFLDTPGIMGSAPQYQQQMSRFRNSTSGLVQGLHSGRHG